MSKMIYRLIAMCLLSVSLTMFAQSGDSMKREQSQPDQMKHDDGMKHDAMKNDKKTKKNKKTKDSMKHGDKPNQN
jgi:pentapeptide MXKDX repeat protein